MESQFQNVFTWNSEDEIALTNSGWNEEIVWTGSLEHRTIVINVAHSHRHRRGSGQRLELGRISGQDPENMSVQCLAVQFFPSRDHAARLADLEELRSFQWIPEKK